MMNGRKSCAGAEARCHVDVHAFFTARSHVVEVGLDPEEDVGHTELEQLIRFIFRQGTERRETGVAQLGQAKLFVVFDESPERSDEVNLFEQVFVLNDGRDGSAARPANDVLQLLKTGLRREQLDPLVLECG